MGRPAGVVGRTQLKQDDLVRIQTLSRDARMGPSEIRRVTGYSIHQIKYALKKKTPTVGKRSGRPRKNGDGRGTGTGGRAKLDGAAVPVEGAAAEVVECGSEVFDDGGVGPEGSSGVEEDEDGEGMEVDLEAAAGGGVADQAGSASSQQQQRLQQQQQEQRLPAGHGESEQLPAETIHETRRGQ